MAVARRPRVSTVRRVTSGRQGPRAPMNLVERMQVRAALLVNAYIDRIMRALEPELRKRFLVTDSNSDVVGVDRRAAPAAANLAGGEQRVARPIGSHYTPVAQLLAGQAGSAGSADEGQGCLQRLGLRGVHAEDERRRHADAEDKKRAPITLARRSLESLGALPADANDRQSTLQGLRESEEFARTGRAPRSFDREGHEVGIKVVVERDGTLILRDGRHRFQVAKELGIDSIWGTVVDHRGKVLFVGDLPLKAAAQEGAAPVAAAVFESGQTSLSTPFLQGMFHTIDVQAANDLAQVIGVSTRDVLPNARKLEQKWVRENTDLIKLEQRARREVEAIITDPLRQGRRVEAIREEIQERLGVVRSRAELIARDQTLKVYGQIQEERQQNAGITQYVWSTSDDERVRPDHEDLDGTVQSWDSPPVVDKRTGRRAHPGGDFQCRCAPVPVLDD